MKSPLPDTHGGRSDACATVSDGVRAWTHGHDERASTEGDGLYVRKLGRGGEALCRRMGYVLVC